MKRKTFIDAMFIICGITVIIGLISDDLLTTKLFLVVTILLVLIVLRYVAYLIKGHDIEINADIPFKFNELLH